MITTIFSKEKGRRVTLFHIFANVFNIKQLDSYICYCFQSVVMCCFGQSNENLAHRYMAGKGKFKTLFRPLWIFFFDTIPKLISGGFLKVSCYVESETTLINFSNSVNVKIH